jgi:hypothetical protein
MALALGWAFSIGLGLLVHRDYFSCLLTFLLIVFADIQHSTAKDHGLLRLNVGRLSRCVIIGSLCWLILMCYSIVVRAEPRWIEAVFYNCLNALALIRLILLSAEAPAARAAALVVEPSRITLDGKDVSGLFGGSCHRILIQFIKGDGSANCRAIMNCGVEGADCKASLCRKYRNAYNDVRQLRVILETLAVGTILAPANKNRVVDEGWRLRLNAPSCPVNISNLEK